MKSEKRKIKIVKKNYRQVQEKHTLREKQKVKRSVEKRATI